MLAPVCSVREIILLARSRLKVKLRPVLRCKVSLIQLMRWGPRAYTKTTFSMNQTFWSHEKQEWPTNNIPAYLCFRVVLIDDIPEAGDARHRHLVSKILTQVYINQVVDLQWKRRMLSFQPMLAWKAAFGRSLFLVSSRELKIQQGNELDSRKTCDSLSSWCG